MVYSCLPVEDVAVQGHNLLAQRSDHVCALPPTCTWAMDLHSAHKTAADRTGLRQEKDKAARGSEAHSAEAEFQL